MKKLFTLIILAFAYYSNAQLPSYIPSNGLVGYWPFNGNANDESGNGNNGNVNGATLSVDQIGAVNRAYHFNGVNSYISVQNSPSIQINSISQSISFWFKIPSIPNPINEHALFEKMDQHLNTDPTGGSAKGIKISFSNTNMFYAIKNGSGNNWGFGTISNNLFNLNSFQHVVFTNDGSNIRSYLNGVLINTSSVPTGASLGLNTNNFYMGKETWMSNGASMDLFNGDLDDIGIWNRALSQQEINAIYTGIPVCSTPIATITPQGNTSICQGGSVNLNASTGSNYTYEWYKDGQLINGATASVYQVSLSGNYTVKVIDGVCNATSSAVSVVVNAIPNNGVTVNGNTTFCQGGSTSLTAQGLGTYLWSNGATSQAINVTQSGNYSVVVTQNGCSATSNQTAITVNPLPTATITPQGNTTFCQGGFVNLVASGGSTYQWNTGAQTTSISVNQSGTYTVNVFNQYNCQASASQTVTVNTNPTVTLSSIPSVVYKTSAPIQLVGNPTGGTFSGDAVSGSTFTPANATLGRKTIAYNYTSQQGCNGSASQTTIVADTVGNVCSTYDTLRIKVKFTAGLYANTTNTVKFYPNPTNDILFIDNGNYQAMSGYSIKIVSLTGTVVYNQPITTQQVQISMNQFAVKGLYFAQIFDPNNQLVDAKKIVLE